MLREDGRLWGWMHGKEDKLQTGTLIRSLMYRVNKQQRQEELGSISANGKKRMDAKKPAHCK